MEEKNWYVTKITAKCLFYDNKIASIVITLHLSSLLTIVHFIANLLNCQSIKHAPHKRTSASSVQYEIMDLLDTHSYTYCNV